MLYLKYLFLLSLIFKVNCSQGQDAPSKLGPYIVGKTTYIDFLKINSYTGNSPNIIKTNDELFNAKVSANKDYFINSTIFELRPNYTKEIPINQNMILANDSTTSFFINQLNFDTYCVNNVFLNFFNDTLISISYDGAEKVKEVLLDKYKKKGTLGKSEFSKSECKGKDKKGKALKDERMLLSFSEKETDVFTVLLLYLNFDSECNFYQYINVRIFNFSKFESVYNYSLNWKKRHEYLYKNAKVEIKEKEKSNL